ncbi:MAG: GNAT superfamily N-acetyltransferase [Chlamydiales bacterium]|jgi:GNAT superfamily N-acetyltransferase
MDTTAQKELSRAEALMSTDPRSTEPLSEDYPLVFGEHAPGSVITVDEEVDGEVQVRAVCGILVRELIVPGARLRVGLIGSVMTDAEHRGQGWGRLLLDKAEEALRNEGCICSMLWADDAAFYDSLGYSAVGTEYDYVLDAALSAILPSMQGVREMRDDDVVAIQRLQSARAVRVERSLDEMRLLLQMPGVQVLVHEHEGEVVAYSCLGRGADFPSVIHEWAGKGEYFLALLQGHIQTRADAGDIDPMVVMASEEDASVRHFFEIIDAHRVCGVLGLAKALDIDVSATVVRDLIGDRVDVSITDEGTLELKGPEGQVTMANAELLGTLLEPRGERIAVEQLEASLGAQLPELPLRPFVWGLDSI